MKISWGIKIFITFSIFASGIIGMVVISFSRNIDLVSENYYEQEIKYQQQIDLLQSSKLLDESLKASVQDGDVVLNIMNSKAFNNPQGEINFYRASDASLDFNVLFSPDESGSQRISHKNLEEQGLWKIKINIKDEERRFYTEKIVHILK